MVTIGDGHRAQPVGVPQVESNSGVVWPVGTPDPQ